MAIGQPPIAQLVDLLRSGQLPQLVRQAGECAARWPGSGPVWHLLGLAHLNLGQAGEAVAPLRKAAKLLPTEGQIGEQLAIALMQSNQPREAYRAFESCLPRAAEQLPILVNLGHLANDLGKHAEAERHCRKALRIAADNAQARFNLGRALRGLGQNEAAIAAFHEALQRVPDSPVAHNDIGLQLQELGAIAEAESCFRRAIAIAPAYALAHSNLGRLLEERGQTQAALSAFRQAADLDPNLAEAHVNIGEILNVLQQFKEAELACRRALQIAPGSSGALRTLGNALFGQKNYPEAEASYRQALIGVGNHDDTLNNLGNLLLELRRYEEASVVFRRIKDDDGTAVGTSYRCSSFLCDWRQRVDDEAAIRMLLKRDDVCIAPFDLLALAGEDAPALQKRAGWLYAKKHFHAALEAPPLVARDARPSRDRLRIGYLSADFYNHATMHLLVGVLEAHERNRFAVHLYSYGPDVADAFRQRALAAAEVFREFRAVSDESAAKQIAADGIDILVDLKGYSQGTRLGITALRPAPVVISWLVYPGTLGHERLADYIIGDPIVTPMEYANALSERILQLPHCYQSNDRARVIGNPPTRAEAGLPQSGFVFCSFNQSFKFNPETADVWARLLLEIPQSVLWLLAPGPAAEDNLRREFSHRGVLPQRLIFAPRLPLEDHLGRLQLADLALDTFPCTSHTTGSDALWVGVPMVTRTGNTFASRVGASLLHAVGLKELITEDWAGYFALASALAKDPQSLTALRQKLMAQRLDAPLFDTARFTRDLESLYEKVWAP